MPIILNGTTGITTPGITNTGPFIFEGTVTVPQGSATTPSISVTAGLNTGIYFPSTSSIALTTAGTQRVLVNSSGNVGIGTSTLTTAKLNVIGTGNANSIMTETAAYIGTSANGLFIGSDSADTMIGVNNSGTKLTLLSRSGGVYSKALSIDDGGNILIGVNANASISGGTVELTGGSSGDNNNSGFSISFVHNSTTLNAYISGQKSEFDIATYGSTPMVFLTNNTERARVTAGGSVGIGTTSIENLLQVAGAMGLNHSAMRSSNTTGDFTITLGGLSTLTGSNWESAGLLVFYSGTDTDQTDSNILLTALFLRGLSTWGIASTSNVVGTATTTTANATSTGLDITFDVSNDNFGSVFAVVLGGSLNGGSRPTISITA